MRAALPAFLLLAGCGGQPAAPEGRSEAQLAPVRMAVQEGIGLLDCSRAAVPLQAGYAEEERGFRALLRQAEALGLRTDLERWRKDHEAAMATADVACYPKRLTDELKLVNRRLDAALKELG